jgi:hypothetical protein
LQFGSRSELSFWSSVAWVMPIKAAWLLQRWTPKKCCYETHHASKVQFANFQGLCTQSGPRSVCDIKSNHPAAEGDFNRRWFYCSDEKPFVRFEPVSLVVFSSKLTIPRQLIQSTPSTYLYKIFHTTLVFVVHTYVCTCVLLWPSD